MNRRILVIDDEYTIRTIVQTALEVTHGWQILQASNATAGLDLAQAEQRRHFIRCDDARIRRLHPIETASV